MASNLFSNRWTHDETNTEDLATGLTISIWLMKCSGFLRWPWANTWSEHCQHLEETRLSHLSSTILKDDWPGLKVHQEHWFQLKEDDMESGRYKTEKTSVESETLKHLCLGPVQLLFRDSTCYRHQLSYQYLKATWFVSRRQTFRAKPYLCKFNQALWVWGSMNAEYARVVVSMVICCRRIHPVVLKDKCSQESRMINQEWEKVKQEAPCWALWCKVWCTSPCQVLLLRSCHHPPSSCSAHRRGWSRGAGGRRFQDLSNRRW